jgi:hypothetical protein
MPILAVPEFVDGVPARPEAPWSEERLRAYRLRRIGSPEDFERAMEAWEADRPPYNPLHPQRWTAWRRRSPKERVRDRVRYAVQRGQLIRPSTCPECGATSPPPLEAHHPDYSRPLLVLWRCHDCHERLTSELKQARLGPWPWTDAQVRRYDRLAIP